MNALQNKESTASALHKTAVSASIRICVRHF